MRTTDGIDVYTYSTTSSCWIPHGTCTCYISHDEPLHTKPEIAVATCTNCKTVLVAAGRMLRCPRCRRRFTIKSLVKKKLKQNLTRPQRRELSRND